MIECLFVRVIEMLRKNSCCRRRAQRFKSTTKYWKRDKEGLRESFLKMPGGATEVGSGASKIYNGKRGNREK